MHYIHLDRNAELSLTKQLYQFYKGAILEGTMKPNEQLPSTRSLAKDLNIARNVILECYEQLQAEGYVYSRNGSGTFVSEGVNYMRQPQQENMVAKKPKQSKTTISFRTGVPDLYQIPIAKWAQLYKDCMLKVSVKELDYQNSLGNYSLRKQLAQYLYKTRGVLTTPERIVITNGAAQAFSMLAKLVKDEEHVLVENPLSKGILHTLEACSVAMRPIEVDACGMVTQHLPEEAPRLIFTTPSHQFPMGVVLPIRRRIQLIEYARRQNAYVVEDDYDSEFRFDGDPIQSMQSLDPEAVIYVGTFSKTFMPAIRIGYMVLPASLLSVMEDIKYVDDLHSPNFEQIVLAKFIEQGLYERHISKMRRLYVKKRNFLMTCLHTEFGSTVSVAGEAAGMHLIAHFKNTVFDKKLMQRIQEQVDILAVSEHCLVGTEMEKIQDALIFGYGNTSLEHIQEGVHRIRELLYTERESNGENTVIE